MVTFTGFIFAFSCHFSIFCSSFFFSLFFRGWGLV
uniref:Uncharacterized protein n=1 Tax=Rhizophora mucronata TaxID=61149 RepID=A0A2P2PWU8_RHIMU